jgi:hypothetical protein
MHEEIFDRELLQTQQRTRYQEFRHLWFLTLVLTDLLKKEEMQQCQLKDE